MILDYISASHTMKPTSYYVCKIFVCKHHLRFLLISGCVWTFSSWIFLDTVHYSFGFYVWSISIWFGDLGLHLCQLHHETSKSLCVTNICVNVTFFSFFSLWLDFVFLDMIGRYSSFMWIMWSVWSWFSDLGLHCLPLTSRNNKSLYIQKVFHFCQFLTVIM